MFKDKFQKGVFKELIRLCDLPGLCKVTAGTVIVVVMSLNSIFV